MEYFKFAVDVIYFMFLWFVFLIESYYVIKYAKGVFTNEDESKLAYYIKAIKYNGVSLIIALVYGILNYVIYPVL